MVASVHRSAWDKVREDYELGNFKTLKELSERHSVGYSALRQRIYDEKWREKFRLRTDRVLQVIEEKKLSRVDSYLEKTFKRAEKYEKMIEASQSQASLTNEGIPQLDVDELLSYTKAELNIHALAKSALRISDKIDVTSGGQNIGESFVSAIQKLRGEQGAPQLTEKDLGAVMEAEVVE